MSSTTYSTFESSSYSSSSDSTGNKYTEATISDPSGTTVHRTSQEAGQPAVSETTRIPPGGTAAVQGGTDADRRVEDVTDADRQYEERMEDEYAKREGQSEGLVERETAGLDHTFERLDDDFKEAV
ncbi:MAG: hypothetical protein Q9221_000016 [Calogaya cf. arnoldii]